MLTCSNAGAVVARAAVVDVTRVVVVFGVPILLVAGGIVPSHATRSSVVINARNKTNQGQRKWAIRRNMFIMHPPLVTLYNKFVACIMGMSGDPSKPGMSFEIVSTLYTSLAAAVIFFSPTRICALAPATLASHHRCRRYNL